MLRLTLTLAAAGSALALAAPAAAQFYPAQAQAPYGYGQPGYGHQNNWLYNFRDNRYARMMQDRVKRLRYDIRQMGQMRILSRREVVDLDREAQAVEQRIWRFTRNGVSNSEARKIDRRVRRLEDRVMREANDWNRRPGARRFNPYNYSQYYNNYRGDRDYNSRDDDRGGHRDRDRDGRDDRHEDDRGRDHD